MSDFMGASTQVSNPSQPVGGGQITSSAAPGAAGLGGQMGMTSAVLWLLGGAAALSVAVGVLGRKGVKPQLGHLDVFDAAFNAATVVVLIGTGKLIAYRFHGHKLAQAYLLVV